MTKRGAPDWWLYRPDSIAGPVLDLGELAVRLNSIVTFDRRGDVSWMDGFEFGLIAWRTYTTGAGATVALDSTTARHGGYSVKITTSATNLQFSGIRKHEPMRFKSRWGLEVAFSMPTGRGIISVNFNVFSTAAQYAGRIKWNSLTTQLLYMDADQDDIVLDASLNLLRQDKMWHILKLVLDTDTGKYVRILCDGNTYDMSGIALSTAVSTQIPRAYIDVSCTCAESTSILLYLDDIIITQDEP